jgi:hypothetical protein
MLDLEHGKVISTESQGGNRIRCQIAFAPPKISDLKKYRGQLVLHWKRRTGMTIRIPCIAEVASQWSASPNKAFFGVVPRGAKKCITIEVRSRKHSPINGKRSKLLVRHDLGQLFRIESSVLPKNSLKIDIFIDTTKIEDEKFGIKQGKLDIKDSGGVTVLSLPVAALVK